MSKKQYKIISVLILLLEADIGFFVHDNIIRPYVGDFLAVLLVYFLLRSFSQLSLFAVALISLVIAYAIEFGQYIHIIDRLGFRHSIVTKATIGNSFDWVDMIAYTIAIGIVLLVEKTMMLQKNNNPLL